MHDAAVFSCENGASISLTGTERCRATLMAMTATRAIHILENTCLCACLATPGVWCMKATTRTLLRVIWWC